MKCTGRIVGSLYTAMAAVVCDITRPLFVQGFEMKRLVVILVASSFLFGNFALGAEKVDACVKYETESGWSKGYSVQVNVISGQDLNRAVGSYTRFKSYSTYAVVFWAEGEATILELPALSGGSVPMFESTVKDQNGRSWRIKEGHLFCY